MTSALAQRRYADLVTQLGCEQDSRRGWQVSVAHTLGVDPTYISRAVARDCSWVGPKTIARAARRVGISEAFFAAESGAYTDFRDTAATARGWTPESDPGMERVRLLIVAFGEAQDNRRGWQADLARRAAIGPDHLTRILARERRVSLETAARIEVAVRGGAVAPDAIDPEFDVMRALVALDDETRSRVLAWANARWSR